MNTNGNFPSNILVIDGSNWERLSDFMKYLFRAQEILEIMQNVYEDLAA